MIVGTIVAGGIGARILAAEAQRQGAVAAALLEAAQAGVVVLQARTPKDLGDARRGIVALPGRGGDEVARIDCTAPHFVILERGARPHMPPLGPLVRWVMRHAESFSLTGDDLEKAAVGVAMAIRWKIFNHGQKPLWIVRGALPTLSAIARRLVAARHRE